MRATRAQEDMRSRKETIDERKRIPVFNERNCLDCDVHGNRHLYELSYSYRSIILFGQECRYLAISLDLEDRGDPPALIRHAVMLNQCDAMGVFKQRRRSDR